MKGNRKASDSTPGRMTVHQERPLPVPLAIAPRLVRCTWPMWECNQYVFTHGRTPLAHMYGDMPVCRQHFEVMSASEALLEIAESE